jgi:PDZ domain
MTRFALSLFCLALGVLPLWAQSAPTEATGPRFGIRIEMDGIYVQGVEDGSAAARAGLRPGDVITRCGEADIVDFDAMRAWIVAADSTQAHAFQVSRAGKDGRWRENRVVEFRFGADKTLGITIAEGLRITRVVPKSPAEAAGLQAGDFLTRFADLEGPNGEALTQKIAALRGNPQRGGSFSVGYIRDNRDREGKGRMLAAPARPTPLRLPSPNPRPGVTHHNPKFAAPKVIMQPLRELEGVAAAEDDLRAALAILKARAGDDGELLRALDLVTKAQSRLEPAARLWRNMRGAMGKAEATLDGAMKMMEGLDADVDLEDVIERFSELMAEGVDSKRLKSLLEREFGEVIERMEVEEDEGRLRIHVEPKAPQAPKKKPASRRSDEAPKR